MTVRAFHHDRPEWPVAGATGDDAAPVTHGLAISHDVTLADRAVRVFYFCSVAWMSRDGLQFDLGPSRA